MDTTDLDPEEVHQRALARRSALEDLSEYDLGTFIELHSPQYERPVHLADLLEALDRSMREPVFCLVEVAPRHGKTETFLHGLARRLRYRPHDQVNYCAYTGQLALRKSRKTREIAARAGIWALDETVRRDRFDPSNSVSYWQTVEGGSFTAGGRNGNFVGDGYQMTVYDDPFRNRDEAESPVIQEKAIETWRSLATRIEEGGSGFVTHQAWNTSDPIAVLSAELDTPDSQAWELISLPAVIDAIYDDDERLIGGTPLWPARWSLRGLARKKHDVGTYNWFSQYTNDRRNRGEALFTDPARYTQPVVDGAVVVISCDPGLVEDQMRDSSGIVAASCYRRAGPFHTPQKPQLESRLDVLHAEDKWFDVPTLLDHLEHLQTNVYRGAPVLLEEVAAFKALSQVARRLNPKLRLYPVTPRASKYLRAQPCAQAWNRGRVRVPIDSPWVLAFVRQVLRFTGRAGGRDNVVDALTQLFDYADRALLLLGGAETGGDLTMSSSPF